MGLTIGDRGTPRREERPMHRTISRLSRFLVLQVKQDTRLQRVISSLFTDLLLKIPWGEGLCFHGNPRAGNNTHIRFSASTWSPLQGPVFQASSSFYFPGTIFSLALCLPNFSSSLEIVLSCHLSKMPLLISQLGQMPFPWAILS